MKVLRFNKRDIVLTELSGVRQAFYRLPTLNRWYPVLDIYSTFGTHFDNRPTFGLSTYFDYDLDGNPTPLHRYGTHLNRGVARMLEFMEIPEGITSSLQEVQRFIR